MPPRSLKRAAAQRPDEDVRPLTALQSFADGTGAPCTRPKQATLAWDIALAALLGTTLREYEIRPVVVQDSTARQFFVERPPRRRPYGGDKWRFTGGTKGGVDHTYRDDLGVRKRYGQLIRGGDNTGRESLKFMCFSLLSRASADAKWEEQRDVVLYAVAGVTDKPPGRAAPEAVAVAERPAPAQVTSASWFGGLGIRPAAFETIDVGASDGFFAGVLRRMPRWQPEESAPKASPDSPHARHLEPASTINAARPWPATSSGEYASPDPELDGDWDQTDDTGSDSAQWDPFAEMDALSPSLGLDVWEVMSSASSGFGSSPYSDQDEGGQDWWTQLDVGAEKPRGNRLYDIESIWAREALEAEAAKELLVGPAEVDDLVDSVAGLMRNLSIAVVETPEDPVRMQLAGPATSKSASGTLDPREERGHGQALPKSSSLTGRLLLPAGNAVRECVELHAAMRLQDPAAGQVEEEVRPEWAAACLTARGGNVEPAAELLGKYMQWRDRYCIASEGQPSSQRMQV